jgi:hypothetical protein
MREQRYRSMYVFLISGLDGGEWSVSLPGRLTPKFRTPGTHWTGGWVGPRADLDAMKRKIFCSYWEQNLDSSAV